MDDRVTTMRRCAKCTQPNVRVRHVTQHYSRGIPMGKTYTHTCGACNAEFETLSLWKSLSDAFFALLIAGGGAFLFVSALPPFYYTLTSPAGIAALSGIEGGIWARLGGGVLVGALGGLWLVSVGWQNLSLFRNPPA